MYLHGQITGDELAETSPRPHPPSQPPVTPRTPRTARQSGLESSLRESASVDDPPRPAECRNMARGDAVVPAAVRGQPQKRSPPTAAHAVDEAAVDHDKEQQTTSSASKRMRSANLEVCVSLCFSTVIVIQYGEDIVISLQL